MSLTKIRDYIASTPPVVNIDCAGSCLGNGAGWKKIELFMKQGYRFVVDPKSMISILVRFKYTINCAGQRYTFPTRVIMLHGLREMSIESIEMFFATYEAQADYVDEASGRKVHLSYHIQRVPYDCAMAWRMVVNKS